MSHPHYVGTLQRSFKQAVIHLLETEYGLLGSGRVLSLLAADLQHLADQFHPPANYLQSGWLVFTGTKASGHKTHPGQSGGAHELVTLAWPVLLPEDIQRRVLCENSFKAALAKAAELAGNNDLICIAGSLYLVGEARKVLQGEII